jgi:hypothetical protein
LLIGSHGDIGYSSAVDRGPFHTDPPIISKAALDDTIKGWKLTSFPWLQ